MFPVLRKVLARNSNEQSQRLFFRRTLDAQLFFSLLHYLELFHFGISYLCAGCLRGGSTKWNFSIKKFFSSVFSTAAGWSSAFPIARGGGQTNLHSRKSTSEELFQAEILFSS